MCVSVRDLNAGKHTGNFGGDKMKTRSKRFTGMVMAAWLMVWAVIWLPALATQRSFGSRVVLDVLAVLTLLAVIPVLRVVRGKK